MISKTFFAYKFNFFVHLNHDLREGTSPYFQRVLLLLVINLDLNFLKHGCSFIDIKKLLVVNSYFFQPIL